jgi:hypothetical protein
MQIKYITKAESVGSNLQPRRKTPRSTIEPIRVWVQSHYQSRINRLCVPAFCLTPRYKGSITAFDNVIAIAESFHTFFKHSLRYSGFATSANPIRAALDKTRRFGITLNWF